MSTFAPVADIESFPRLVGRQVESKAANKLKLASGTLPAGLEIVNLRKSYGDLLAVDDVSFRLNPGEVLGLIGPNGAGKSTCMTMMIGLLRPDSGMIRLNGRIFDPHNPEMRFLLGIAPQELAIYPDLTAAQNLRFFGSLYGLKGRLLEKRVDHVLQITGLSPNADRTPSTFSGGMQRRLNFGIALLHEPQYVILDEPTVGVDPQSRSNLLDCVRDLASRGVGVLYASHYMEEVEAVCDRVAIMDHGRLLQQGTLDELLDRTQMELSVKVGQLAPDLASKIGDRASVQVASDGTTEILIRENLDAWNEVRPAELRYVLDLLESGNVRLLGIETHETSLETLFLRLTGRKLRD